MAFNAQQYANDLARRKASAAPGSSDYKKLNDELYRVMHNQKVTPTYKPPSNQKPQGSQMTGGSTGYSSSPGTNNSNVSDAMAQVFGSKPVTVLPGTEKYQPTYEPEPEPMPDYMALFEQLNGRSNELEQFIISQSKAADEKNAQNQQALLAMIQQQQKQSKDTQTSQLFEQFQQAMNAMNNKNSDQWKTLQDQANAQAKKIADEKKASLQGAIDSIKGNQKTELEALQNNLLEGQQSIQDNSFMNWMQQRQGIADRGLAGSGLQQDANLRLQFNQQKNLSGLYRDTMNQLSGTNNKYGSQLSDLYKQLSGINENEIGSDLFQELYKSGNEGLLNQAKLYSDMLGKTIGYDYASAGDRLKAQTDAARLQFDYQKLGSDERRALQDALANNRQFYDELMTKYGYEYNKLDSDSKLKFEEMLHEDKRFYDGLKTEYGFKYDQLASEEKRAFDALDAENQRFAAKLKQDGYIDMSKMMGYDITTGKPTLDMMKLSEQIRNNLTKAAESQRHNLVSEGTAALRAQISAGNLELNTAKFEQSIIDNENKVKLDLMKLDNSQWSTQGSMLNNYVENETAKAKMIMEQMKVQKGNKSAQESLATQLETVMKNIDAGSLALRKAAGIAETAKKSNTRGNLE